MNTRKFSIFILTVLVFSFFLNYPLPNVGMAKTAPEVYVGIDVAYGDLDEIKELADKTSTYTNLFVLGCTG